MATVYRRGDVWWVRVRFNGVHVRRSARTSKKAEAQTYLHKLIEEHAQASRGEVLPRHLLTEAMDRFFEETSLKTGTVETYRCISRILARLLGELHLAEI